MPGRSKVRVVGEKRGERLRKINRNVSNKKSRLRMNKGLEAQGIDLKSPEDFSSVKEFNRYVKEMEHFLERGAGDFAVRNNNGVQLNYGDVLGLEKDVRKLNRQKKKDWDAVKNEIDVNRNMSLEQLKNIQEHLDLPVDPRFEIYEPTDIHSLNFESPENFKKFADQIRKKVTGGYDEAKQRWQDNYLLALERNFNLSGNDSQIVFSKSVQEVYDKIKNMSNHEFLKLITSGRLKPLEYSYGFEAENQKVKAIRKGLGMAEKVA